MLVLKKLSSRLSALSLRTRKEKNMRPKRYPYKKSAQRQTKKGITYKFVNTEKSVIADALDVSIDESNEGRKYGRKNIILAIAD